jgi:hypothetical protein
MRILDIITLVSDRIIAQADNGFLYWSRPAHDDPFQALKRATIDWQSHKWLLWDIGASEDLDEIANRLKEECLTKHGFPYRPKSAIPA